jgi:DNA ligase (NAD+)
VVFGGVTAERMFDSFISKIDFIQDLYNVGFEVQEKKRNNVGALNFVITGTLSKPRKEFEKMIEEAGYVYQSSLTKDTNFLVIGENTGANKTKKAEKLGTKIITELGLIELLEGKQ